eukprot:comp18859_c3_seq1/m.20908 comp18859_c3_seq1/g.20908  ORF comp18859_c3_seq1/g.20908 comp18859_c3_seq1/m.20908 type:complete len:593 (-) comp18859_c3_seq1:362-2140(-)
MVGSPAAGSQMRLRIHGRTIGLLAGLLTLTLFIHPRLSGIMKGVVTTGFHAARQQDAGTPEIQPHELREALKQLALHRKQADSEALQAHVDPSKPERSIPASDGFVSSSTEEFKGLKTHAQQEIWAGGARAINETLKKEVEKLLKPNEQEELKQLCGRCLLHSFYNTITVHNKGTDVYVSTGDIDEMWLRDSSVQIGQLLARMGERPALRAIVEGTIRRQAFYVLQDPYANAFSKAYTHPTKMELKWRKIGRGGWVGTRNYELDSGTYFLNLLWNYYNSPDIYDPERLLSEPSIYEAANLMADIWIIEQNHETKSKYRYMELPRGGLGPESAYTGMSWSGYRPSDDQNKYGYNIPGNMYAYGALERALYLNKMIWRMQSFDVKVRKLMNDIKAGIEKYGIISPPDDRTNKIYAYEVDGLGNTLYDFDDPNLPSLLSIPLLGYRHYDPQIYANTVKRLYTSKNPYYFKGTEFDGLGSPHTYTQYVWPLAEVALALTRNDPNQRAKSLRILLKMQCGNGLMHESVNVNDLNACSRMDFGWANVMLVTLMENTLGLVCDDVAEEMRHQQVLKSAQSPGDDPLWYNLMEAEINYAS